MSSFARLSRKVVFLDRDGVLNIDLGYTFKIKDLTLVEGVVEGLRKLQDAGYEFIVVTNQSGVARGMYTMKDVETFHQELTHKIQSIDPSISILEFKTCPHLPGAEVAEFAVDCECRKPKTKLVLDAVAKYNIDVSKSWMIGDKAGDIECAINSNLRGIQVTQGGKQYAHHANPFAKCKNLNEAADIIISNS